MLDGAVDVDVSGLSGDVPGRNDRNLDLATLVRTKMVLVGHRETHDYTANPFAESAQGEAEAALNVSIERPRPLAFQPSNFDVHGTAIFQALTPGPT